jgi:hypothetical protein
MTQIFDVAHSYCCPPFIRVSYHGLQSQCDSKLYHEVVCSILVNILSPEMNKDHFSGRYALGSDNFKDVFPVQI